MIRRDTSSGTCLITQHDHALLAGRLAAHLGNHLFETPSPLDRFVTAVSLHDSGWPLHDDAPTLNPKGQPIDVFESTPDIALKVWSASVERAAAEGDYAGLLASLHALSLSVNASTAVEQKHEHFDLANPTNRFDLNKFQHRQVELQESFRKRLGMRTDLPLRQGLAQESQDPAEMELTFAFRFLQAMDQLSLAICCTKPPSSQIKPVLARPGGRALSLRVQRPDDHTLHVAPWPFKVDRIAEQVEYRLLQAEPFNSAEDFATAYSNSPVKTLSFTLLPGR